MSECLHCGRRLPKRKDGAAGRPRHYCNDKCRARAYTAKRRVTSTIHLDTPGGHFMFQVSDQGRRVTVTRNGRVMQVVE